MLNNNTFKCFILLKINSILVVKYNYHLRLKITVIYYYIIHLVLTHLLAHDYIVSILFEKFLLWFSYNLLKMLVIFFIGFIIRYLINKYLGINAFLDYTCIISIVYYLNLNGTVVYINNCDLSINTFKFIIN